jgi:hypothetical protein
MTAKYPWYDLYVTAVLETDCIKILGRIQTAEFKLRERQRDVSQHGTNEGIEALAKCLDALRLRGFWPAASLRIAGDLTHRST